MPTSISSCRKLIRLGYNSNGLAHHDIFSAIELLADVGYQSIALTLDHGFLNPFDLEWPARLANLQKHLSRFSLSCVIETGARFLLNPRQKHEPTLISADATGRQKRLDFYRHAIETAAYLEADCMSIWSGVRQDAARDDTAFDRLIEGLHRTLDFAATQNVVVAFEPEPGMFIDTMARFGELMNRLQRPDLKLTLDIGHLHCLGEIPVADQIRSWGRQIANVHIEDMRFGIHEHLMFGEGEMDFPPVIDALCEVGYEGGLHVELSRHSHDAPRVVQASFDFLHPLLKASSE